MNKFIHILGKPVFIASVIVAVFFIFGVLRIMYYIKSPDINFLINRDGAQWIKYDSEFELQAKPEGQTRCEFKYVFNTGKKIEGAVISVQALKNAVVFFDGIKISSGNHEFNEWKKIRDVKVPVIVEAGAHEILMIVTSENSYPVVWAHSEKLHVKTGPDWFASDDGRNWSPAAPASIIKKPKILEILPSSFEALTAILPSLTIIFWITFFISWFGGRTQKALSPWLKWKPQPSDVRWIIFFLWALLSLNNMFNLNYQVGTDGWGHIEYIHYIATKGTLPLAPEGWHMFQPPLNYLLSAPLYAVLIKWLDLPSVVKIMTIVPLLCGLIQIEIVYRTAKLVFVDRKDLQIIAVMAGSFLPIHTYACQYVGNEPLAACLVSLIVLLCASLIMPGQQERGYGYFVFVGLIWGLALLSKITAMLLAPVLIVVIAFHTWPVKKTLRSVWRPVMTVFFVAMVVAGWYYLRNYIKLGNAFMGLFDPLTMLQWWQDPGYRMWPHLLSFGEALRQPVYAGLTSFWDMFYATLWLDGINSGLVDFIPWNRNFMIAGTLLALVPSVFIVTGVIFQVLNKDDKQKRAVIFSIALILLFLAAMIDMYIVCPLYSRTKASYTLGLLPCYAILISAGAEPFLRKRIIRSIALGLFASWAFAAYAAYFVVGFQ